MPAARVLPSELNIYTVAELHPQWLAWLAEGPEGEALVLDGAAVEQADGAGVQLLLSLAAALRERGLALGLHEPSAPLLQACAALGLADWAAGLATTPRAAA